jgi:hypothetical protein
VMVLDDNLPLVKRLAMLVRRSNPAVDGSNH